MMANRWLVLCGAVAILGSGVGCVQTCHSVYADCLRPVEEVPVIAPARAKVYVFLMNGADWFDIGHLKELECSLVQAGFPKVYYAQRFDQEWYYKELHRLRRDDPDNRFVLIGRGTAADQMHQLACRVTADGIPLDAVVFLDPVGDIRDLTEDTPYFTTVVRSRIWPGSRKLIPSQELRIREVGHLHLPNHPATVQELVGILTQSALRVPIVRKPIECIPLTDEPRPIPRPDEPKVITLPPPEWHFLCPNPGQL